MKVGPRCKMCRREGKKLFLKGERCYSTKCALVKKKYPPGAHGPKGYSRLSEYGLQLREKQCLKRVYGILERQIRNYFAKAKEKPGNTETNLLKLLELRLDNVVYRAGFTPSRRSARQIISHGNILVNSQRVDIPSYQVKVGDIIGLRQKKAIIDKTKEQLELKKSEDTLPAWLNLDKKNIQIKVLKEPGPEDLPKDFETKLIVEFYSR